MAHHPFGSDGPASGRCSAVPTAYRSCELVAMALVIVGLSYGPMLITTGARRAPTASHEYSSGKGPIDALRAAVIAWDSDPNVDSFEGFALGCGNMPHGCQIGGCEVTTSSSTSAPSADPATCPGAFRYASMHERTEPIAVRSIYGGMELPSYLALQLGLPEAPNSTFLAGSGGLLSTITLSTNGSSSSSSAAKTITTVPRVGFSFPNVDYFELDVAYTRRASRRMVCTRSLCTDGCGVGTFRCSHAAMAARCGDLANWGYSGNSSSSSGNAPPRNSYTYTISPSASSTSGGLGGGSGGPLHRLCAAGEECGVCEWDEYLQRFCVVLRPSSSPGGSGQLRWERDPAYGSCEYPFTANASATYDDEDIVAAAPPMQAMTDLMAAATDGAAGLGGGGSAAEAELGGQPYSTVPVEFPPIVMRLAGDPQLALERATYGTNTFGTTDGASGKKALAGATIAGGALLIIAALVAVVAGCGCSRGFFVLGPVGGGGAGDAYRGDSSAEEEDASSNSDDNSDPFGGTANKNKKKDKKCRRRAAADVVVVREVRGASNAPDHSRASSGFSAYAYAGGGDNGGAAGGRDPTYERVEMSPR